MSTAKIMGALALVLAVPGTASGAGQSGDSGAAAPVAPLQDCDAHRFETVIERIVDGEPRQSRLKLCGQKGQSDADWILTLEDAITKVRANLEMPADTRAKVVAAISREIVRLKDPTAAAPALALPSTTLSPAITPRAKRDTRDIRDDFTALPPLPPPVTGSPIAPPSVTLRTGSTAVQATPNADGRLPSPDTSPAAPSARSYASTLGAVSNLSFDCYVPGGIGGPAPCAEIERETLLTVRARADLPSGAELHFERNGVDRASVPIAPLRKGRSVRLSLPRDVCAGFGAGRLSLVVWIDGRPSGQEGPFPLRC